VRLPPPLCKNPFALAPRKVLKAFRCQVLLSEEGKSVDPRICGFVHGKPSPAFVHPELAVQRKLAAAQEGGCPFPLCASTPDAQAPRGVFRAVTCHNRVAWWLHSVPRHIHGPMGKEEGGEWSGDPVWQGGCGGRESLTQNH